MSSKPRIGVVSPGARPRMKAVQQGVDILESAGFDVVLGSELTREHSGTSSLGREKERLDELRSLIFDETIDALWVSSGGLGSSALLPGLAKEARGWPRKALLGSGDATALQLFWVLHGWPAWVVPNVVCETTADQMSLSECAERLFEYSERARSSEGEARVPVDVLQRGCKTGRLLGGSLTSLAQVVGSPYAPPIDGSILLIDERNPLRSDQLWSLLQRLQLISALKGVHGLALGEIVITEGMYFPDVYEIVREALKEAKGIPICCGFPHGASEMVMPFPLGGPAELEVKDGNAKLKWEIPAMGATARSR